MDFPASDIEHRTVVKPGVDEELDDYKRTLAGMDDLLSRAATNIGASIPVPHANDLEVNYYPQLGFLISMPIDPKTKRAQFEGGEGDAKWERYFSTADKIFFKDYRMQELDEILGDLQTTIYGKNFSECGALSDWDRSRD